MDIVNAKDKLLTAVNTLPQVGATLNSWFREISFNQVLKTTVNNQTVETLTPTSFMGVRQPFGPEELRSDFGNPRAVIGVVNGKKDSQR
jgi:hypothetical protein